VDKRVERIGSLVLVLFFFYLYAWQGWSMEEYIMENNSLPITIGLIMPLWAVLAGISMNLPQFSAIRGVDWAKVILHGLPAFFLAFGPQLNFLLYTYSGINLLAGILPTTWIFFLDKLDLPMVGGIWLGIILTTSLRQEG